MNSKWQMEIEKEKNEDQRYKFIALYYLKKNDRRVSLLQITSLR